MTCSQRGSGYADQTFALLGFCPRFFPLCFKSHSLPLQNYPLTPKST